MKIQINNIKIEKVEKEQRLNRLILILKKGMLKTVRRRNELEKLSGKSTASKNGLKD